MRTFSPLENSIFSLPFLRRGISRIIELLKDMCNVVASVSLSILRQLFVANNSVLNVDNVKRTRRNILALTLNNKCRHLLLLGTILWNFWLDVIYILPLTEIYWKKKLTVSTLSHVVSTSCRRCLTSCRRRLTSCRRRLTSCRRQLKVLKVLKVFVTSNGSRAEGESLIRP